MGTPSVSSPGTPSGTRSDYFTPSAAGSRTPLTLEERPTAIAEYLIHRIREYQQEHLYKFVGAGLTKKSLEMSPHLAARLWWELDIVPLVFETGLEYPYPHKARHHSNVLVDEEADSMARKALMYEHGPQMG